ncbi:MAG: hypothetical protein K2K98_12785 [Muribaculaceae bacterium]|nr:hypothetical protein [Muribaculaceae bacterium]
MKKIKLYLTLALAILLPMAAVAQKQISRPTKPQKEQTPGKKQNTGKKQDRGSASQSSSSNKPKVQASTPTKNKPVMHAEAFDLNLDENAESDGRKMIKLSFNMKSTGVKGHILKPVIIIEKADGTPHKHPDGSLIEWKSNASYEAKYDETSWTEGNWLGIYCDRLDPLPGTNKYAALIKIWDETLGKYITDESDVKRMWFNYTGDPLATAYNLKLDKDAMSDGRKMIKVSFNMKSSGAKGHILKPVIIIQRADGTPHKHHDGSPVEWKSNANYEAKYDETTWTDDGNWLGIYSDRLDPLPGNNKYAAVIKIWDETLGKYISDEKNLQRCWFDYYGSSFGK